MSLINEALKKAQSRQTGGGTPPANLGSAIPPPNHRGPTGPSGWTIFFILLIIGIFFTGGAVLIAWAFMGGKEEPIPQKQVVQATPAESDHSPSQVSVEPIRFTNPDDLLDESPKPAPPNVATTVSDEPEVESPPLPKPELTEEAEELIAAKSEIFNPTIKPDRVIQEYIKGLEIRGVMSNGQKVLLFDAQTQKSVAYEVGSTINNQLQVFIRKISKDTIYFTDNAGVIYIKRF